MRSAGSGAMLAALRKGLQQRHRNRGDALAPPREPEVVRRRGLHADRSPVGAERRRQRLFHPGAVRTHPDLLDDDDAVQVHQPRDLRSLDDVLDFTNAAANRLVMYKITEPPPAAAELAGLIVLQSEELARGVSLLEKNGAVLKHCDEVNRLEDEADHVSRRAIALLFDNEKDPIQLIKLKELYEVLEIATDKAEDAANVLEAIVLKSA